MRKFFTISFLILFFAGCGSSGTMVTEKDTEKFKVGVTTEQEIRAKLGKPNFVHKSKGKKFLVYEGSKSKTRIGNYIPFVSLFSSGAEVEGSNVQFEIGKDGRLVDISRTDMNTDFDVF